MSSISMIVLALAVSFTDCITPEYNILVVIPDVGEALEASVENGDGILAGAELAERRLHQLHLPFTLNVRKLVTDCRLESSQPSLVRLARELLTDNDARSLTVAVVGFFCKRTLHELELIGVGRQDRLGLVQISVNTLLPVSVDNSRRPHFLQVFPSSLAYAEALSQFMEHVGWTRVGIAFTEQQKSYHFEIFQQVIGYLKEKGPERDIQVFKVTNDIGALREKRIVQVIESIHISGVKIINVFLPPLETALLLCGAYDYGLRWPDYGWIVFESKLWDVTDLPSCNTEAIEGVIHFQTVLRAIEAQNLSSQETFQNIYTKGIYDSILSISIVLNKTYPQVREFLAGSAISKVRAQKTVSYVMGQTLMQSNYTPVSASKVDIAAFQNIADNIGNIFTLNINKSTPAGGSIPGDKINRVYSYLPLPLEVFLTLCTTVCLLTAILNFVLYVYYRKAPEIKASSFRLSMMLHLGSLGMIIGGLIYISARSSVVTESFKVCATLNWLIYPSGDIILATLLVKLVRVQYIFNHHGKVNMKLCGDATLLLLIACIVAGKAALLAIWMSLDMVRIMDFEIYHPETKPPHYEVQQHCQSRYSTLWLSVLLSYTAILGFVLGFVAFRARKIKHKDFNDTKKIIMCITVSFTSIAVIVPIWWIVRASGDMDASTTVLALLYMILPMSCQICHFCPKTFPPLIRSICSYVHRHTESHPQLRGFLFKGLVHLNGGAQVKAELNH